MLEVKEFEYEITTRIVSYYLICNVIIDGKEHKVSAIVNEDELNATKFDWNYGYENISEENLDKLEEEMLDKLFN